MKSIQIYKWRLAQVFELIWWKRYLKRKTPLDYLQWKRMYWSDFLLKIELSVKELPKNEILDAGCGPAGIFIAFKKADLTAIDPLLNRYEDSIDHFSKEDYKNVRFINSGLEGFTSLKKFDYIFCINAINHVNNIESSLKNLQSFLKEDGTLVISVDAHRNPIVEKLFQFLPFDILHPYQFKLNRYCNMIIHAGFKIEKTVRIKRGLIFDYSVMICHKN